MERSFLSVAYFSEMQKNEKQRGMVRVAAKVRAGASLESPCVGRLARGTRVRLAMERRRVKNRKGFVVSRVKLVEPCVGWISVSVLARDSLLKCVLLLEKIVKTLMEYLRHRTKKSLQQKSEKTILDQDHETVLYSKTRPRRSSI